MNLPRTENIIEARRYTPGTAAKLIGLSAATYRAWYAQNRLAATVSSTGRIEFSGTQLREAFERRELPSIERTRKHPRRAQSRKEIEDTVNIINLPESQPISHNP